MTSVMRDLNTLEPQNRPIQDVYTNAGNPPAYDDIHEACTHWRTAAKAQHDSMALDKDPELIAAAKDLEDARALFQQLKSKRCSTYHPSLRCSLQDHERDYDVSILSSEQVFKASYAKRNSIGSLIRPKTPKLTFPWHKSKRSSSAPVYPVDRVGATNAPAATIDPVSRITSQDSAIHGAFRLAHEAEVNQEFVVRALENRITAFKRKVCSYHTSPFM